MKTIPHITDKHVYLCDNNLRKGGFSFHKDTPMHFTEMDYCPEVSCLNVVATDDPRMAKLSPSDALYIRENRPEVLDLEDGKLTADGFVVVVREDDRPMWLKELSKVNQCPQRQDSLSHQLADLRVIANKFGFYDAADFLKR